MILVTGGAGFVGSNLVHALAARGEAVIVADDLTDARKYRNLVGARVADYLDRAELATALHDGNGLEAVTAVLHQGACTSTTEPDGRKVLLDNLSASKAVLRFCLEREIPLVYASSAAVYGSSTRFAEDPVNESPLNVYGWSKLLVDEVVRRALPGARSPVVGLRYFNVYGPREAHKGDMASVVLQLDDQLRADGTMTIFGAGAGCGPGDHRRDFVFVDDVVAVVLWFLDHPDASGIFNLGTGRARSFGELAAAVGAARGGGELRHRPFPAELEGVYQPFTEADLTRLRAVGCDVAFTELEAGVERYLRWRSEVGERAG